MSENESDSGTEERNESLEAPIQVLTDKEIIKTLLTSSSVNIKNFIPNGPLKSKDICKIANWILSSNSKKKSSSHILQRIKWLTAIVQYGIIDSLADLEKLFNPFVQLIYIIKYQPSVCHLLYMIATPKLYKFQVERITKAVNIVGLTKPLAGLLSRLKSLRPDLVPQSVPHQSSAVSFPKAPASMRNSLYELSEQIKEQQELPSNRQSLEKEISNRTTKKAKIDILPRAQHINLKSSFEVDFRKLVLLTQFNAFDDLVMKITKVEMPNHVGSLLSKREFHYVLAYNWTPHMEALLSQWLYLSLCHEFLEKSLLIGKESKELFLNRIIEFQQSTGLKLMAVYDFLSEFLVSWDGIQYNQQIFQLLADMPFMPYPDLYGNFLHSLEDLFRCCETPHRLKITNVCKQLIYNLLLQKFGPAEKARSILRNSETLSSSDASQLVEGVYVISEVIRFTERLINMALTSSTDLTLVLDSLFLYSWLIDVEADFQLPFRTFCQPITVYLALFSPAPVTISTLCLLLCKYQKLGRKQLLTISVLPELEEFLQDSQENASMLNRYVIDTSSCLIYQTAFVAESASSLLSKVPRKILKDVSVLGSYKAAFDLKRNPSFTGIARQWIKSKLGNESGSKISQYLKLSQVFEDVDSDSDEYLRYLFSCFPTIRDYIQQFHSN